MTDQEKSENLDKILNALTNLEGQGKSVEKLSNELKIDKNSILHLCELLSEDGFTEDFSPNHDEFDKTFNIKYKGELKRKAGGFIKDFETHLQKEEQEISDENLNRTKLKTDIAKNIIWIVRAISGCFLYIIIDFFGKLFFSFDLTDFLLGLFNLLR